jgi:2-methylisocitrate lyase-like PEP mutase family enzyme
MDSNQQLERAQRFRKLHDSGTFVIANCWDGGSTAIARSLGYAAIATSSGAAAATYGRLDGAITLDEALAHCKLICDSTSLPVAADLEKGFADAPGDVAKNITRAAGAGLVGCSIEDATGRKDAPIFDFGFAVERIAAAVDAARKLPFPFTLTARTENFLRDRNDLDDTIRRLQAFEKAGADVLFAPGLPDLAAVRAVCSAVTKPVNFMAAIRGKSFSVAELRDAGVRRISLATGLYRAAMTGLEAALTEVRDSGTFGYVDRTMTSGDFVKHLSK